MSKTEIQPFIALIGRVGQVRQPLFLSHGGPLGVSALVAPDVVDLCEHIERNIHAHHA